MMLVLVIPHEWGHMIVARMCGVRIKEFSVGMGPLIFKKQKGDTQYSLRLLPLGGYCMMEGEEEAVDSPTSYSSKSYPQKIAILLAGVTMNIIIAIVVVSVALWISGALTNTLESVVPDSPAAQAGLEAGDTIVAINGKDTPEWADVVEGIDSYKEGDAPLEITYERGGKEATASVTPEYNEERKAFMVGINSKVTHNFFKTAVHGPAATWQLNAAMLSGFRMLFTGQLTKDDVAGPVGLVRVVDQASDYGIVPYLTLLALVSLNLAFFNLLPIPGLDGGKIFFIFLKIISGGRITDDMEYKATLAGVALLLLLFVLITVNDVMNLFGN